MLFCRNLCEKRQIWVFEPVLGKLEWRQPSLMIPSKAHGPLSIRINWTSFAIYHGSGVIRRNVYSSAVFAGGWPLCTKFYMDRVVPYQPFLASENSRQVPLFWHNTGVWRTDRRQTNRRAVGRICRSIYSACKAMYGTL